MSLLNKKKTLLLSFCDTFSADIFTMLQKAMMSTVSKKVKRFLLEMETDQRCVQEGPGKLLAVFGLKLVGS